MTDSIRLTDARRLSPKARELFENMNLLCAGATLDDSAEACGLLVASILLCAERWDGTITRERLVADFAKCVESNMEANKDAEFASQSGAA